MPTKTEKFKEIGYYLDGDLTVEDSDGWNFLYNVAENRTYDDLATMMYRQTIMVRVLLDKLGGRVRVTPKDWHEAHGRTLDIIDDTTHTLLEMDDLEDVLEDLPE